MRYYLGNERYAIDSRDYKRSRIDKKHTQNEDIRIAKELGYSQEVIGLLKNEPDQFKRQTILTNARTGMYNRKK